MEKQELSTHEYIKLDSVHQMAMVFDMSDILLVTSSALGDYSTGRRIAQRLIEAALESGAVNVTERDLRSLAHIDLDFLRALRTEAPERTPAQAERVAEADAVIEEVENADLIIITCPIYASSIPSTLKAWLEYMNRAGRTFRHDHDGHVGLITGKQVCIVVTRGSEPAAGLRAYAEGYLEAILGSFGMNDIAFINAHETAHEDGPRQVASAEERASAFGRAFGQARSSR